MDIYGAVRSLPFPVVAAALGIDLTKFKTRKKESEWYGACPIHAPKSNSTSFSYNTDGRYFCFSCSAKGKGALDLTVAVKRIGFKDAVELLTPLVGQTPTPTEKAPLGAESDVVVALKPFTGKYEKFAKPCPWLEARVPDEAIRKLYGVFMYDNPSRRSAWSGRVMIPIRDVEGVLYGYLGRLPTPSSKPLPSEKSRQHQKVDDSSSVQPKYLFPKNLPKSRFLFGADVLKAGKFGQVPLKLVYLVESPFCVMAFASLGFPAVSCYGWSISDTQIELLSGLAKGLVFLPDDNKRNETSAILPKLSQKVWLRFPPLPAGVDDPEQLSKQAILDLTK